MKFIIKPGGIFFVWICLLMGTLQAQGLYISRYIPGDYLSNNQHRVDIYNPLPQTVYLGGWMLATRDYVMKFPAGTRIGRESALQIGKARDAGKTPDLALNKVPDFIIHIRNRDYQGNYVALMNPQGDLVDAFYFSPLPKVPYLPHYDTLITYNRQKIGYYLPPESKRPWEYISMAEDPAIAFVQLNNKWQITSAMGSAETPTAYGNFSLRYDEGVVALKWSTRFERQCGPHIIERSEDQQNFVEVDRVPSQTDSRTIEQYEHFIVEPRRDQTFYYRLRAEDVFGNEAVSRVAGITTEDGIKEFSLEAFMGKGAGDPQLNVRFVSRYSQQVKIQLLDERLREVAVLFGDYVYADTPNLLKIKRPEATGTYWVLVETEARRFWEKVEIE